MADDGPRWITDTGRAVRLASDAAQAHDELRARNAALRDLNQVRDELYDLAQADRLGRGSWWAGTSVPARARSALAMIGEDLERRSLSNVVKELKRFTGDTRNAIQLAWSNNVDSHTGDTAELAELVDLLVENCSLGSIAKRLKQSLASLPELRSRLPCTSSVEGLATTVELAKAFEAALPIAVRRFISAAARGGASVTLLTEEVLAWLTDNSAINNFKVIAGRPQAVARG